MKVKVGDTVKIIAGKDKGKEGKVLKTFKGENKVVVEGLNIVKKHSKPNNTNDKGGIFDIEAPIHASNVKVVSGEKKAKKAKTEKVVEAKVEEKKAPAKKKTTKKTSKKDGE
jgi:large subunit ribosomal protein L24